MSSDRYSAFRSSNYGISDGGTISIDIQLSWDHICVAYLRYPKLMAIPSNHVSDCLDRAYSHPSNSDHNSAFRFATN